MSKTSLKTTEEWKEIPWRKLERITFKLQKRIYRASQRGNVKAVRQLQKTLMRSWSAKCLAVRRVTQDNQGKKTAGIDGIKSLSPVQRLKLVQNLKLSRKAKPTRRVWIPKPGTEEKRPLGIPTMTDRALQALVKLALEPEWEALFEPNSFGFRPGRSCHDAIEAIFMAISQKDKYVLDADIAKCFDRINHQALLNKLNTFPTIRRQIRAWLKAGVIDWKAYANRQKAHSPTTEGTPQGGVLSPLLANIALHGLENQIRQTFPLLRKHQRETWFHKKGKSFNPPNVIRYADDFVVLHESLAVVQSCQQIIVEWLKDIGLELKPTKTRISHTLNRYQKNIGFDFLGFNIRQYAQESGFKTLIKPSKEALKRHTEKVGNIIKDHKSKPQVALIKTLNPVIKGWSNYYRSGVSSKTFRKADANTYQQLYAWAKFSHKSTPVKQLVKKCWHRVGNDTWVFSCKDDNGKLVKLEKHAKTKIFRHVKVKENASPYDGNLVYWSTRMGKHPECPKHLAKLLKEQNGKCTWCDLYFKDGDLIETDHKIPISKGGKNEHNNLQLLHKHCHDQKTANDYQQSAHQELGSEWDDNPF